MGGVSGGSQNDFQRQQQGYASGQSSWQPGQDWDSLGVDSAGSNLEQGYFAGWSDMQKAWEQQQAMSSWGGGGGGVDYGAANAEAEATRQAEYEKQQEDARRKAGEGERDSLYSQRMDAAGTSTDYINTMINSERSNSRLMNIDYDITDEQKQTRINDYFGTVWGEGSEARLDALMGEWGAPAGHADWTTKRGTGDTLKPTEGSEETVGSSGGMKPQSALTEDDDTLGGGTTVLG